MTRPCVVLSAIIGAAAAGLLGAFYPWWVVLLAEVFVAGVTAYATFTMHQHIATHARMEATRATMRAFQRSAAPHAYRALWDHPRLLLTWVAPDGTVLRQMGGALRLLPLDPQGWTGRKLEEDSEVARILPHALTKAVAYDLDWTTPKGDRTHWVGVAAPFGGSDGTPAGVLYAALLLNHPGGHRG